MSQCIIYPTPENKLAIIIPASCGLSIDEIARKDVPAGLPYLIIDANDIPSDRTYREAWMADFSNPDGYGIGHELWFATQGGDHHV